MPLTKGMRIGNYEVGPPLGAGGMGEVYQARDTRLDRSVAIKALPESVAGDRERLGRFEREAKLLASLNHPNIAGIHGIEDDGGASYLVLEFVEGETLAQRLARGPLTVRETLDVGVQIASAIEAAHEGGIVHRDLKPGNVMLTPSKAVKVLDFGLAKGNEGQTSVSSVDLSASPTVAMTATAQGIILGTAPYMSPEQARGRPVDRRADVWAFGCILVECLTGRQTFAGETVSDVIARILEREPDWNDLPASAPPRLRDLLKRCLTKEVGERPRDIGDLGRELSQIRLDISSLSAATQTAGEVPSLAVLYFDNLADDKESEYFCSGITEDIITDLSKIKGLRVASRNAVSRYRGQTTDVTKVAEDLGVKAVLEGSVRRAGDRVRISAELINGADGLNLWADRYDRTLQDVFAVQEEIASSIAEALRVALSPAESESLGKDRPKDVQAYDLYLKGRQHYGEYTAESFQKGLDLFHQAIEIDPEYALAWAGVADTYGQMLQWDVAEDPDEAVRLGLEAAHKAISINPRLAEAYKAESLVRRHTGDIEGSVAAIHKAIEANPRFTPALINLAVEKFGNCDVAGNERLLRRVLEIDPQDAFSTAWLATTVAVTSRDEESLALTERLRRLSDERFYVTMVHAVRALVHLARGDIAAVERTIEEGRADNCEPNNLRAMEVTVALAHGRRDDARRIVADLQDVKGLFTGSVGVLAAAAEQLGESEWADRYLARGGIAMLVPCWARLDPYMHGLLDREPYAPRRLDQTLVWPLEAPMIDATRFALFKEVRIESALPKGSEIGL